jgi:hypothetical protein
MEDLKASPAEEPVWVPGFVVRVTAEPISGAAATIWADLWVMGVPVGSVETIEVRFLTLGIVPVSVKGDLG